MDSLLKDIHAMGQTPTRPPIQAPPAIDQLIAHPAWASEFLSHEQQSGVRSFVVKYVRSLLKLNIIYFLRLQ